MTDSVGFYIFIGLILMLIAEFSGILYLMKTMFAPPSKRSQNTKIKKPKTSYRSSDYTIHDSSFHVVDSGDD